MIFLAAASIFFPTALYALAYAFSVASVLAILLAFFVRSRKAEAKFSLDRIISLNKEETGRLGSKDPVFLMHLSIALGVGLSILIALLDPFLGLLPPLRITLLIVSLPLDAGLIAALVWRVDRFRQSKEAQKLVATDSSFNSASAYLQFILILAIFLTTSELVISWFPTITGVDLVLNIFRNLLVVLYYIKPSVNLVQFFDRPLWELRVPFKLSEVMEGKVDPSNVTVGVSKMSEFPKYEKLSYDSCVEIGACESACPATAAGRPLSPRIVVRKASLLGQESGDPDPFGKIKEEELWSCVTCGACVQSCPVAVKHLDVIYDLRRNLVNTGKLDKDKATMLQNLVQNQNPYGFNSSSRADWARDQGIDTLATNPSAEYLYWVGCVSSFDQRAQNVAKALSKILKKAGISFAILGTEEMCTGDPARRLGEEGRYQELAFQNIERLNNYKVKKIITSCPHCFNALKNEYPVFGGNYTVIHHSQLISDLIKEGKIKVKLKASSLTLHDACYAARYNSIFEEPREALSATTDDLREMHRIKDKTFCCGAGGSNYWYKVPNQKRTITSIRTEEAQRTGAKTLATECPFCLSMFEDSMRTSTSPMAVRDLAEIVAEEIND